MTHLAQWWQPQNNGRVLCTLCPRHCKIGEGQAGFCYIRKNIDGELFSLGYGRPTAVAVDPIEKKPLNHFLPGTQILSIGTAGCNLGCKFCQNWSISKAKMDERNADEASPVDIIEAAESKRIPSIAFTYNDPIIFGEYVIDTSRLAREHNIRSVMVTNGYIGKEARPEVFQYIDAANVDLKAFSEKFYRELTFAHIQPVLDTLIWLKQETDIWLELTTLLIPGKNDTDEEIKSMCDWILNNLGDSVPLHFSAFHPAFRMKDIPATPVQTVLHARELALSAGLKYCYVGNVHQPEAQSTFCHNCQKTLIERNWHQIHFLKIQNGKCLNCGQEIEGHWGN